MWNHLSCHTLSSVLGIVVLCPSNCHFPLICRNLRYSWWNSKKSLKFFNFFQKFQFFSEFENFFENFRFFQKRPFFRKVTKNKIFEFFEFFWNFQNFRFFFSFFQKFRFFFHFSIFSFFIFVFIFSPLLVFGQSSIVFEFSMTFCLTLWRKNSLL